MADLRAENVLSLSSETQGTIFLALSKKKKKKPKWKENVKVRILENILKFLTEPYYGNGTYSNPVIRKCYDERNYWL